MPPEVTLRHLHAHLLAGISQLPTVFERCGVLVGHVSGYKVDNLSKTSSGVCPSNSGAFSSVSAKPVSSHFDSGK